jgi:hypothetical protein
MDDYLSRLIQRTSGQTPAIKPLVRSTYSAIQRVNQSTSEFKEQVTLNEESSTVPAAIQPPEKSRTGPLEGTPKPALVEKHNETIKSNPPDKRLSTGIRREQAAPFQDSRKTNDNNIVVSHNRIITPDDMKETQSEKEAQTGERISGKSPSKLDLEPEANMKSGPPGSPKRKGERVSSPLIIEKKAGDRVASSLQPEVEPVRNEMETSRQNTSPDRHPERLISPDPGFIGDRKEMVVTEPVQDRNLVKKYRPEARISNWNERMNPEIGRESVSTRQEPAETNIKVTIGRVEIKAVRQPERQIPRAPSIQRKPVISLDAYLEGRNEEGR